MHTIDELLAEVPAFGGMSAAHLELIAGCAENTGFADGEYIEREGEPADHFYVIRHGAAALETYAPPGGALIIETLHEHELLGWSWLFPPYRTHFDIRAVGDARVIAFDAVCLRGKLEDDPLLGYELMRRFAAVMIDRLQATRRRLLDVYGKQVQTHGEHVPGD